MMMFIHHESSNMIGGQNAVNIQQTDRQKKHTYNT